MLNEVARFAILISTYPPLTVKYGFEVTLHRLSKSHSFSALSNVFQALFELSTKFRSPTRSDL
jgi:hypothetical protein